MTGAAAEAGRARAKAWGAVFVFVLAFSVRLAAVTHDDEGPAFLKYPGAAKTIADGTLQGPRVLDFSPLYLDLHRFAYWAGVSKTNTLQVIQCLLGALAALLVFAIGVHALGLASAVIAGLVTALSLDMAVYSLVLDADTTLVVMVLLSLWLLRADVRGRGRLLRPAASGLALGLAIAARPTAWLFFPVVLLQCHRTTREKRGLLAFLALFVVVQVGLVARGHALGGGTDHVMSPWQVLHTGNNPMTEGLYLPDRLVRDVEAELPPTEPAIGHRVYRTLAVAAGYPETDPDRFWLDLTLRFAAAYPGRVATLLGQKVLAIGQPHNGHDNTHAEALDDIFSRWNLLGTSLLVPLGLAGLVLGWRRLWPLALVALGQALVCVVFFVSARYRLMMVPCLALGAAGLLQRLCALARDLWRNPRVWRSCRSVLVAAAVAAGLALLFRLPLPPGYFEAQARDLRQRANVAYLDAEGPLREHRLVHAARKLAESLYIAPWHHARLPVPRVPFDPSSSARLQILKARHAAHASDDPWAWLRVGWLAELAGRWSEASRAFAKATDRARLPGLRKLAFWADFRRGVIALRQGRRDDAYAAFKRAASALPGAPEAMAGIAITSPSEAERRRARDLARRVNPGPEVDYHEGRLLLDAGLPREALAPLTRLVSRLPGYARGRMLYAVALFGAGRVDQAAGEALQAQRQYPPLFDSVYRPTELLEHEARRRSSPAFWRTVATVAEHYGELERALAAWRHADRLRRLTPEERARVGWLLLDHEQPGRAIPWFEAALTDSPALAPARRGMALASMRGRKTR